ncbi:MAG: LLM class F420-dependent oxidoreductase [Candidatus Rokuibacteriota bacterium]|nr:MAG: LLM class F420-dependent oxidoreductase [Candidatus Rokubacteria bacterium]
MKFGFGIPNAGAAINGADIVKYVQRVEQLGYESIWTGDHIILPTGGTTQYPYTADGSFPLASTENFLEPFTLLAYVAAVTKRVKIGTTVIILPYRNPIEQAKMLSCLDVLSGGRLICGVGVGWLEKEFEVLGASYKDRGPVSDEYIEIFKTLWTEDEPTFNGRFYSFDGITMYPKPVQKPHPPIWVGGHSKAAVRRAARLGDAWHPTRQTREHVAQHLPYLREEAERIGRDPRTITISLKRSLEFTDIGLSGQVLRRSGGSLIGTTQDVIDDVRRCQDIGIDQLTFDFRTGRLDEVLTIVEHFATAVMAKIEG